MKKAKIHMADGGDIVIELFEKEAPGTVQNFVDVYKRQGHIGIDAIARIVTHPKLTNLPFYLETPNELDGYAKEIAMLRSIVENQ